MSGPARVRTVSFLQQKGKTAKKAADDDEPLVVKSAPSADVAKKSKSEISNRTSPENPAKYWDNYFKKNDMSANDLWGVVYEYRSEKKFNHVEAALRSYLIHRTKNAEPWMYEMLAVTIELRKGPASEVKTLLGYAAYQAKLGKNPTHLVSVADLLLLRGITDKVGPAGNQTDVGELLDLAAEVIPHRAEPNLMSIKLAGKTKDPKRMEAAADRVLSLGWLGVDDQVRADVRKEIMALVKTLREDGRDEDASGLLAKLPQMESRDIYIKASWVGEADIDILVDEPLGATACFATPRTVFGGSIIKNGYLSRPEEIYVAPRAFSGEYKVRVDVIFNDPVKSARKVEIKIILHEGAADEKVITQTVDLAKPEPVVFRLDGGRRTKVLPLGVARELVPGDATKGRPSDAPKTKGEPAKKAASPSIKP